MATLTVRNLSDETRRRLKERAARHDRSMEAEARLILEAAVSRADPIAQWLQDTAMARGDDLPVPERTAPREVRLG